MSVKMARTVQPGFHRAHALLVVIVDDRHWGKVCAVLAQHGGNHVEAHALGHGFELGVLPACLVEHLEGVEASPGLEQTLDGVGIRSL